MDAILYQDSRRLNNVKVDENTPSGTVYKKGNYYGVFIFDTPAGTEGTVALQGVVRVLKKEGSESSFEVGDTVYYNETAKTLHKNKSSGYILLGLCYKPLDVYGDKQYVGVDLDHLPRPNGK